MVILSSTFKTFMICFSYISVKCTWQFTQPGVHYRLRRAGINTKVIFLQCNKIRHQYNHSLNGPKIQTQNELGTLLLEKKEKPFVLILLHHSAFEYAALAAKPEHN